MSTNMRPGLALPCSLQASHRSPEARERYLEFLSSGGSRYPLDILERAGVDMRTSQPVDAALHRFDELLSELNQMLGTQVNGG